MNTTETMQYVGEMWDSSIVPSLVEYIKIPNKSPHFDLNWQQHGFMDEATQHIFDWCHAHAPKGMQSEIVQLPGRTPLIFMEIPGTVDETVLLYGHLDKQPEMEGWDEGLGPWKPVIKDGKLYGRGGADDGYAAYASITAINALQQQGLGHCRAVVIIEACEESGSYDLPFYIDALKDRIGSPKLVVCLDSGAGNYEQLWMTTSLRGNIVGELEASVIEEGVHSGNASGIVADSFRVIRQLLARIEDEDSGEILLNSLKSDIPQQRVLQAKHCADVLQQSIYEAFPFQKGTLPVSQDLTELVLNRTWRATLSITGADGLPSVEDAGNVSRPKTSLKLSVRTPPDCDIDKATAELTEILLTNPPLNSKVRFHCDEGASGWNAPALAPWLERACEQASQAYFKKSAVYMGEGGTIPFMGMLGEKFPEAQFMITGVLGPKSNAHGPNEFLHIDMGKRVTCCVASVLHQHHQMVSNEA